MRIANILRRLFRRQPARTFRVGDLVRYDRRAMAIADIAGNRAQLVWHEGDGSLRTCGFKPISKLKVWSDD